MKRAKNRRVRTARNQRAHAKQCIESLEARPMLTAAPTGLTAVAGYTGIALNWSTVASATYDVYRGSYSAGESSTPLATNASATHFLDPSADLLSGHDYYYSVTAIASSAQSAFSNEAYAYAAGAYDAPTVDFNAGFPTTSSSQFTSTTAVFNSNKAITLNGGSLQYNQQVNTKQFNLQYQVESLPNDPSVPISLQLVTTSGKSVTIFDGTRYDWVANFGAPATGDFTVQIAYSQILLQGTTYIYVTNGGDSTGDSLGINIPATLGSDVAYAKFFVNSTGAQPTLDNWFYVNSLLLPPMAPSVTTSSSSILLTYPTTVLGYNSQSDFGYSTEARIFRGTAPGQESLTPIGTVPLGATFTDTTAVPGQTYYYVADGGSGASTAEVSATIPATQQAIQLIGTPIGTQQSWDGTGTIAQAFDGNLNTFFDPANGNLTNWVGLDLGKATTITQIKYAARAGYEYRMLDGQFQVSSTPDFSSNVVTLSTITATPVAGQLTAINVNPGSGYRYIRYTGGLQWVNIAEMQVFGLQVPPPISTVQYAGNPIGTPGGWTSTSTVANAFDGNTSTYFDPATGSLADWAGLDLVAPVTITQISYAPRAGYEFRMVGGQFQVSSTPDFSSDVHTIYTVTAPPVAGQLTTVTVPAVGAYRYVRYTGGTQWVNIAEMQVAGPTPPVPLTGAVIGTTNSWSSSSGAAAAFDGSLSTFFDPATGDLTDWAGLDLGSAKTITQIKFAGRAGYEFRMVGAQIQVSSTPDFSSNVQTIYTVTAAPPQGQVVTIEVAPVTARYIRYVGGTQWVNIAELEVDGM